MLFLLVFPLHHFFLDISNDSQLFFLLDMHPHNQQDQQEKNHNVLNERKIHYILIKKERFYQVISVPMD